VFGTALTPLIARFYGASKMAATRSLFITLNGFRYTSNIVETVRIELT